jgi:diaminopimelate epimerase
VSRTLPFSKMQGCGNDYVVVDAFHHAVADPTALARRVSDRRYGVGSDGLILALPSDRADLRMRMFNVDGSESEMCGNGLRCLARFAYERGLVRREQRLTAETGAGILGLELHPGRGGAVESVTIDMGRPRLERSEVPMTGGPGRAVDEPIPLADRALTITAVSMGNPHAVTYVDDPDAYPVERVGPEVERHARFPRRTNVHFVQVVSPSEVRMRTWERGCGETLACGTGACAVAVAGVLSGRTGRDLLLHVRGGELRVRWDEDSGPGAGGHVFLTGPAVEVFQGTLAA